MKGVIAWVGVNNPVPAEVRLYDRLFSEAHAESDGRSFLTNLNPSSMKVVTAFFEPSLVATKADDNSV